MVIELNEKLENWQDSSMVIELNEKLKNWQDS